MLFRLASDSPTTHSSPPSSNQRPPLAMCHHGLVPATPVSNVPSSPRSTRWFTHVPMSVVSALVDEAKKVPDITDKLPTVTGTSKNGVNPLILFRQKICFSFGKSSTGKYAP